MLQTLAWTSCQKNEKPSILIIAVDRLASDLATCTEESNPEKSGIALFCKESIRFTHSYTTSTQSAAAMASIITGEYPIHHGLYRSFDRVDKNLTSVAQIAKENNYVTSFFSGSPFIMKKTGLSDYFELFDDSIAASTNEFHQDLRQQSQNFFQWISSARKPFLSIIYNSELNRLSNNETDQSDFEKFDEKLHHLFIELKSNNLWDNTYIFLIGLNGSNKFSRYNLNTLTNLHSENTSVATFIKIPRQKGDEGINWKNDLRISLVDIGMTLKCILKSSCAPKENLFPVLNLSELWKNKDDSAIKKTFDRPLLVQTTDTLDSQIRQHRFSILDENFNYIQNKKNKFEIFNTISDRSELIDLSNSYKISQKYIDYLNDFNFYKIDEVLPKEYQQKQDDFDSLARLNFSFWTRLNNRSSILSQTLKDNNPLMLYQIFNRQKGSKFQNFKSGCTDLVKKSPLTKDDLKACTDDLFIQYLLYTRSTELDLDSEKNKFLYSVMKANYKNTINRISVNLAYSNAWGLYNPNTSFIHPLMYLDPTFFDN